MDDVICGIHSDKSLLGTYLEYQKCVLYRTLMDAENRLLHGRRGVILTRENGPERRRPPWRRCFKYSSLYSSWRQFNLFKKRFDVIY